MIGGPGLIQLIERRFINRPSSIRRVAFVAHSAGNVGSGYPDLPQQIGCQTSIEQQVYGHLSQTGQKYTIFEECRIHRL